VAEEDDCAVLKEECDEGRELIQSMLGQARAEASRGGVSESDIRAMVEAVGLTGF